MTPPIAPLDWHPAYRAHADTLLDWLNGEGPFGHLHILQLPIVPTTRLATAMTFTVERRSDTDAGEPLITVEENEAFIGIASSFVAGMYLEPTRMLTLVRKRAFGPAPWTGEPALYVWFTATDALGRHIAGESHLHRDPVPHRSWGRRWRRW